MFEKTEIARHKKRIPVHLVLADGAKLEGDVFLVRGERLIDMLNDQRGFIPFQDGTGRVTMLSKGQIAEASMAGELAEEIEDPYGLLRIEDTASDAEIRQAWMTRLKSCHPDRLASLNLDEDIISTARRVSQRINAAYDQIIRTRREAKKSA